MGIMVIGWLMSIGFLLIYVLFYEPVTKGLPFNYYILVSIVPKKVHPGEE
jgi:hypothetical protein